MRIIIDIDDSGVVTTRIEPVQAPLELREAVSATPPPEVLKTAKRLGAVSAGPAPLRAPGPRLAATAPASVVDALKAQADVDAGRAPKVPGTAAKRPRKATTKRPGPRRKRTSAAKKKRAAKRKSNARRGRR
ncbi:MAG: hypothetical protein E4H37_08515 [Gemmatimonadales bacterium]|nr:MAG: hypothetical protein E4H37_08515 [Gemmatimonadales bacterium]